MNSYHALVQADRAVNLGRERKPNAHQTLDHGGPAEPTPYVQRVIAEVARMTPKELNQTGYMPLTVPYDHKRACELVAMGRPWWVRLWEMHVAGMRNVEIAAKVCRKRKTIDDVLQQCREILRDVGMQLPPADTKGAGDE